MSDPFENDQGLRKIGELFGCLQKDPTNVEAKVEIGKILTEEQPKSNGTAGSRIYRQAWLRELPFGEQGIEAYCHAYVHQDELRVAARSTCMAQPEKPIVWTPAAKKEAAPLTAEQIQVREKIEKEMADRPRLIAEWRKKALEYFRDGDRLLGSFLLAASVASVEALSGEELEILTKAITGAGYDLRKVSPEKYLAVFREQFNSETEEVREKIVSGAYALKKSPKAKSQKQERTTGERA